MEISNRQKRKYHTIILLLLSFLMIISCSNSKTGHKIFIKDKSITLGETLTAIQKKIHLRKNYDYNETEYMNNIETYYVYDSALNNVTYLDVNFTNTISFTFKDKHLIEVYQSMVVDDESLPKNIEYTALENILYQVKNILIQENENYPPNIVISKNGYWHIVSKWKLASNGKIH